MDEYMQCVDEEGLVENFQAYLEVSKENLMNRYNLPWFDLGDIPSTHSFMRQEAQQVYYVPKNENKNHLYVKYSPIRPYFKLMSAKQKFSESKLPETTVTFREFNNTVNLCSNLLKGYRGKIQ